MRDAMREMFDSLLINEPPVGTTAAEVRQLGQRRLHRRRMIVAAGSAVAVGVTATAAVAYGPGRVPLVASPATIGSPDTTLTPSSGPAPSHTAAPSAQPSYVIPRCEGAGPPMLADDDGSVLPDPGRAAQAVLDAAATIAPGRTLRLVSAERVESSQSHPGAPRVYLIFDVTHPGGTGSINLEVFPQAGMSAPERAAFGGMFGNCFPEPARTDFPDHAVGFEFPPWGTGDPNDSVQHTYYISPAGFDINAGAFLTPWSETLTPPTSSLRPSSPPPPMPLTSAEVLALCRVVALS